MTFRWLKRVFVWSVVGLIVQIPIYYVIDRQVQHVMNPPSLPQGALTQANKYTLDAPNMEKPLVSYDDKFLAFRSGGELSIYDFSKQTVIWKIDQKKKVLAYQWLPDRNALMIFESGLGVNSALPGKPGVGIHSLDVTSNQGEVIDRFASSLPLNFQKSLISNISLSVSSMATYGLLVRTEKTLYQVSPQGSKVLAKGESSFFSPSGKYYYSFNSNSSGTSLKRVLF